MQRSISPTVCSPAASAAAPPLDDGPPVGHPARFAGFCVFQTGRHPDQSHKAWPVEKFFRSQRGQALLRKRKWHIVISSSGNAAISVARATQIYATRGGKVTVVMDALSSREFADRLRKFKHVEVMVINAPDKTGSHVVARQQAVEGLLRDFPDAVVIDQYGRPGTIASFWSCGGYDEMFAQIEAAFPKMSALIMPMGTCASVRNAITYKLRYGRTWAVIGADSLGSGLTGQAQGARSFSGYGNARETLWLSQALPYVHLVAKVGDQATVAASSLLAQGGLFVGASAAASFAAAIGLRERGLLPHRGETVVLLPDNGLLYLSNLYDPNFLTGHDLAHAA